MTIPIAVYTVDDVHCGCTVTVHGDDMNGADKQAAAYVSFKTFLNSIEQLSRAEIPNVIDKTVFTGMAFSVQNQLFAGMRFLGLIDDKSKPTKELEDLAVSDEGSRKKKLKEILHAKYADLFALNLKKATPDELVKKMGESYNVSGDTREKAARFFVSAAAYVGTELSSLLDSAKKTNGGGPGRPRTKRRTSRSDADFELKRNTLPAAESRAVTLSSGVTLTLSSSSGLFSMAPKDRKFVLDLIEKMEAYEQENASSSDASSKPE
jgi:antitoxin component of MazEF toxin-antitoxin module